MDGGGGGGGIKNTSKIKLFMYCKSNLKNNIYV